MDAECFVVTDQRRDGGRVNHDLENGHAHRLVDPGDEQLRDHRYQDRRKLDADLLLLVGGKRVDDAVNGLGRTRRVQRAENQVPGFRRRDRRVDGFQVAHFAHQNDVRVLAQHAPQRFGKVRHVHPDLPLRDNGFLVGVVIFDGVLDGDNVRFVALFVDDVDHRRQGGRLAGAGGSGDQHQPARFVEQFLGGGRQADLLHREHLGGNLAQDDAEVTLGLEDAHAEPRHVPEGKAEVGAAAFADALDVLLGGNAAHQLLAVFRLQRRPFHPVQNAVHANHGRRAHADVQVGSPFRHH